MSDPNADPTRPAPPAGSGHRAWADCTSADFAALDPARTVALLPVSATEQHGPHLPLGTDAILNRGIVDAALPRVPAAHPVLVLPALEIGDSLEHGGFPGTLSAGYGDLISLWLAVGRSVAHAGLRKLVIFNSHGGQKAHVDLAALRLRAEHGMLAVRAHSFSFGVPEGLVAADELAHGLHGGEVETSLVMHLRPDLVRHQALADFDSLGRAWAAPGRLLGIEKPVGIGWLASDLNPHGVCGRARDATPDKGRRLLDHLAGRLAQLLVEVSAQPWPLPAGAD